MTRKSGARVSGKDSAPAFEDVKRQLAYCGLWCGSCLVGNGTLLELARRCQSAFSDYGVHEWGPKGVDYENLLKDLATIGSMEPCPGCLRGGGRTNCEIRTCAIERGVKECVDCDMHGACQNTNLIEHMRSGASRVGMKVKNKKGNRASALDKWIEESGLG